MGIRRTEHRRKENYGCEDQVSLVAESFVREKELLHYLRYGQFKYHSESSYNTHLSADEQLQWEGGEHI